MITWPILHAPHSGYVPTLIWCTLVFTCLITQFVTRSISLQWHLKTREMENYVAVLLVIIIFVILILFRQYVLPYTRVCLICMTCVCTFYIAFQVHKATIASVAFAPTTTFGFPVNMIFTKSSEVTGGFWFAIGVFANTTQCSITRMLGSTSTVISAVVGFLVFVSLPIVSMADYGTLGYTTVMSSIGNWLPIVNGMYSDMQQSTLAHNQSEFTIQELQHQAEVMESDRILLHIVKNNVVDAETVLHVMDTEGISRKLIEHARGLLVRSASWCTLREVVRSMVTDSYVSQGESLSLKPFCEKLLLGRSVPLYDLNAEGEWGQQRL